MFTPESMEQLHIVFHEHDISAVADMLVRHGGLQLVDTADMESWAETLPKAGSGEEVSELRERIFASRCDVGIPRCLGVRFCERTELVGSAEGARNVRGQP